MPPVPPVRRRTSSTPTRPAPYPRTAAAQVKARRGADTIRKGREVLAEMEWWKIVAGQVPEEEDEVEDALQLELEQEDEREEEPETEPEVVPQRPRRTRRARELVATTLLSPRSEASTSRSVNVRDLQSQTIPAPLTDGDFLPGILCRPLRHLPLPRCANAHRYQL